MSWCRLLLKKPIREEFLRHQLNRFRRPRRLTDTYLSDPMLRRLSSEASE